jgi:hypothetical protein
MITLIIQRLSELFDKVGDLFIPMDHISSAGVFWLVRDCPQTPQRPALSIYVGAWDSIHHGRHFDLCQENAELMRAHPACTSANQVDSFKKRKVAGAIRRYGYIFIFSGLPGPYGNEALLLRLLDPKFWADKGCISPKREDLERIAKETGNDVYWRSLLEDKFPGNILCQPSHDLCK